MESIVTVMLFLALAATLFVLVLGIFSMARGGEFNRRHSNTLMRWRVGLGVLALTLFAIHMLLSGKV
jgi:hypothetical protein